MAIVLSLKVKPSSGQQKIVLDKAGVPTCYLKSPPEDGRANHELVVFLSKKLGVIQQAITIVHGLTSRTKRLRIASDDSLAVIYQKLGLPLQSNVG